MTGIALFFGMIGLACAIVIGVGLWTQKRLQRASPDSKALAKLTPTGAALSACLVAVLVVGTAARRLAPDGALGAFLDRPYGVAVALGIAAVAFAAFANILARLGHPVARDRKPGR